MLCRLCTFAVMVAPRAYRSYLSQMLFFLRLYMMCLLRMLLLQSLSIARLYLLLHLMIVWTMLVKLQVAF